MSNQDYLAAERKLIYIRALNKELIKKSAGQEYCKELILGCTNFLGKPKIIVTAQKQIEFSKSQDKLAS